MNQDGGVSPGNPGHERASLANWRQSPWNRWAFQNVKEIIPVAPITATPGRATSLPRRPESLGTVRFAGPDGRVRTIEEMLVESATDGFIVLHKGAIAFEQYNNRLTSRTPHIVFSVSKSITGVLAGSLVEAGVLDPDAPVTRYIPEAQGSAYGDCTVRHVLDMTVSIDFKEDYLDSKGAFARYRIATGWNPVSDPALATDLHSFLVSLPRDQRPHGERFFYVSPNSDLLGWILERAGGRPFAQLLSDRLWQPMGAETDGYVTIDGKGAARSAGGICISLHDAARLGELLRRGGEVEGRQVVPVAWMEDLLNHGDRAAWLASDMAPLLPQGRYRSQWYMAGNDHGAYCAIGIHGQWIYVDPRAEMVIAKFSSQALPVEDATDHLLLAGYAALGRSLAPA